MSMSVISNSVIAISVISFSVISNSLHPPKSVYRYRAEEMEEWDGIRGGKGEREAEGRLITEWSGRLDIKREASQRRKEGEREGTGRVRSGVDLKVVLVRVMLPIDALLTRILAGIIRDIWRGARMHVAYRALLSLPFSDTFIHAPLFLLSSLSISIWYHKIEVLRSWNWLATPVIGYGCPSLYLFDQKNVARPTGTRKTWKTIGRRVELGGHVIW